MYFCVSMRVLCSERFPENGTSFNRVSLLVYGTVSRTWWVTCPRIFDVHVLRVFVVDVTWIVFMLLTTCTQSSVLGTPQAAILPALDKLRKSGILAYTLALIFRTYLLRLFPDSTPKVSHFVWKINSSHSHFVRFEGRGNLCFSSKQYLMVLATNMVFFFFCWSHGF